MTIRTFAHRIVAMLAVAAFFAGGFAFAIDSSEDFEDPKLQARYEKLTEELRCLVCQNQTIADSNAGLAVDLRRETRQMLQDGKSDDEIRSFMVERYGNFVLYRPPVDSNTVFLWAAPAVLLLGGAIVAGVVIRRRAGMEVESEEGDEFAREESNA